MSSLSRQAFLMKLKPGAEAEYAVRHDQIWPDLVTALKAAGISNYSIFRRDLDLFGYLECSDMAALERLPQEPVMQRWWAAMADLMDTHPDHRPVQVQLGEVFHLD
ncbi:MAG: L-rhamnose mutarotase [Candidatus Dormibacteria bacterium]